MMTATNKTKEWTEDDRGLIQERCWIKPAGRAYPDLSLPVMSVNEALSIIKQNCGSVDIFIRGNGRHALIILPEPYEKLVHTIDYGRLSPINIDELKFIGLGHCFATSANTYMTVISHFIQVHTMNRSGGFATCLSQDNTVNPGLEYLTYYREKCIKNEAACNTDAYGAIVDPFLHAFGSSEYCLEGHTHGGQGAFFSSPDKDLGKARATKKPIVSFVCDPIRREMKACTGKDFEDTSIYICEKSPLIHKAAERQTISHKEQFERFFFKVLGIEVVEDEDGWYSV